MPDLTCCAPTRQRISVVLPHPLGPSRPVTPGRHVERDAGQHLALAAYDDEVAHRDDVFHHVLNCATRTRRRQPGEPATQSPRGASFAFCPSKAKSSRSAHPEPAVLLPQVRAEAGLRTMECDAALHRPVEGLHDQARADAGQPAVVELGLAQDVEPERRVREEGVALRVGEAVELGRALPTGAVAQLSLGQRRHRYAGRAQERRHLLAARQAQHPGPQQVAEGQVGADGARVRRATAERTDGQRRRAGRSSRVSIRRARLNSPAGGFSSSSPDLREAVHAGASRRSSWTAVSGSPPRSPLVAGEEEQQVEAPATVGEPRVPVVGVADHRVPEPEGGDRELHRHRRHGQRVGARARRPCGRWRRRRSRRRRRRSAAGSRCGASTGSGARPCAGPSRTARRAAWRARAPPTTRLWNRIIAAWVWATTRFSSLRRSGIAALRASETDPLPTRGTSKPTPRPGRRRSSVVLPDLEAGAGRPRRTPPTPGRADPRRRGCRGRAWASAPGAARPARCCRRTPTVVGVEGQVVVDELPEVGVAGGDRPVEVRAPGHREGDLAQRRLGQPYALRAEAREPEGRRGVQGGAAVGRGVGAGGDRRDGGRVLRTDDALTLDEEALAPVAGCTSFWRVVGMAVEPAPAPGRRTSAISADVWTTTRRSPGCRPGRRSGSAGAPGRSARRRPRPASRPSAAGRRT